MKEIETPEGLTQVLTEPALTDLAIQSLDLAPFEAQLLDKPITGCLFLGCTFTDRLLQHIYRRNYIFPHLDVPYNPYPKALYDRQTLYEHYNPQQPDSYERTLDKITYEHFVRVGKEYGNIMETLAQRLHDHSITDALHDFLTHYPERKVVAVMGGHGLSRDSENYGKVARLSRGLTEQGFLLVSGGGPGAMEATHLGAWLAGKPEATLGEAIVHLSSAPYYDDPRWLPTAFEVLAQHPRSAFRSVGIPTWGYGHEPPTPFASHIAKYFANSIREDGLLAIAKGGVVFAPGSAGTMQEIFQDLAQNHYETHDYASPMVFLDTHYWTHERPVYPVIEQMSSRGDVSNLNIGIYDSIEKIAAHLLRFQDK
ncbi:MAG: hypothetical protein WA958_15395 [Tunicatimonas sp.]